MNKLSPEAQAEIREEAVEWEAEVKRLQALLPAEVTRDTLRSQEIPQLETKLKQTEDEVSKALSSKELVG